MNFGLTVEVAKNAGLKDWAKPEITVSGNLRPMAKPHTTSFSVGEALFIGWEVKVDFTKREYLT